MGLIARIKHAWNAFTSQEDNGYAIVRDNPHVGYVSSIRPDRTYFTRGNERSIATSVFNRIALDCADVDIKHVRLENGRYLEDINSGLNECLTVRANKDQIAKAFLQDAVISMLDEGVIALVPVDTDVDPNDTTSYDVESLRVGKILQWYPDAVQVEVYNDRSGKREQIYMLKRNVAIIENPLYSVINAPNSTLQRLIRKLNLLDAIDEQSGSGKLDLIIQLPYIIKTDARREQAEKRKRDIEEQLAGSKYGIAYTDGTEKITQLNRPVENNLMKQIEYLTNMFYSQLGVTESIMNGTAKEEEMINYHNRTIKPIVSAIAMEIKTKFLTKTARTQGQSIEYFSDPFKLIPVSKLADIADKFTRNEIMSTNEIRQIIGMKPVQDARADELRNKNLNPGEGQEFASTEEISSPDEEVTSEESDFSVGDTPISMLKEN